jgi:hypothetical protein
MVRRLKTEGLANVVDTETVSSEPPPKKRKFQKHLAPAAFDALMTETSVLNSEKRWDEFQAKHFVALYCMLHNHVYKVVPEEARENFKLLVKAADKMLEAHFSGKKQDMIEFVRWVWARESKRNKARDPENDFRIGWRLQFGSTFLSDYRVARARAGKKIQ